MSGPPDRLLPEAEWSPELVMMVPVKWGGLRPGQGYFGINRRRTEQSQAFACVFLGGEAHAGDLGEGMARAAARRKAAVEGC